MRHVECYDPDKDEWCDATDMNMPRSALKACSVYNLKNVKTYTFYGNSDLEERPGMSHWATKDDLHID